MKILINSIPFPPSTGGVESVSCDLAEGFVRSGHDVCVVTETPAPAGFDVQFPYRVCRNIGKLDLLREVLRCDVVLHNSMSVRYAWPLLFCRRRWVIVHQTWLLDPVAKPSFRAKLKASMTRFGVSICISKAIAAQFKYPTFIIGNSYRDAVFQLLPGESRANDLLFVGNLGPLKGVDLLLRAVHLLGERGLLVPLTIVGTGPDEQALKDLTKGLGLSTQVRFVGPKWGEELAREYNRHRVSVVPSRWMEPFGIVAVEALGCGCVVVGSSGGGLIDAIGPAGLTFPNGDVPALADALSLALREETYRSLRSHASAHLEQFKAEHVVGRYLEVLSGSNPK